MARGCSQECTTIVLWMCWVTVWLLTSIYVTLAVIMFAQLWDAASELSLGAQQLASSKVWRAPLSSLVLSALLVFGFNMMCCVTLIKKSVNRSGPGFSYGFMVAFSISLSLFLLLSGLVLDGFRPVVKSTLEPVYDNATGNLTSGVSSWSNYSSEGFVATEVLALISFVTYLVFGFILVGLQSAVSSQLGINEAAGYGIAGAAAPAAPPPYVGEEFKDTPAAPPDYDSYAQYEQYGTGYAQDAQGQQYYDPSALGMYGQAAAPGQQGIGASAGMDGGYVYDASALGGGYGPVDTAPPGAGTPHQLAAHGSTMLAAPTSTYTGYAAISSYNPVTSSDALGSEPAQPGVGRGGAQQI